MKLYEIEPGVWIVPELVWSVTPYTWMEIYSVRIDSIFSGEPVVVRGGKARVREFPKNRGRGNMVTHEVLEDVSALATAAAAEVAAWINERRSEPIEFVRL